jgi:glycerophosphoryl diester phosphodiesterase
LQFHLAEALSDFRRTWVQLLITGLLSFALSVLVSGTVVAGLLALFLRTTEDGVLTDAGIAEFLLHPLGLLAALVVGVLLLGVYLAQVSLLMVIGFGASEGRRVTCLQALRYVARRATGFLHVAQRILRRVLLAAVPCLAVIGAAYWFLLRAHDINYYLADRPPEFLAAAGIAVVAGVVLAFLLLRIAAAWILALPVLLFDGGGGRAALRGSEEATAPHRRRIAGFLVAWIVASSVASSLASLAVGRVGGLLVPDLRGNELLVLVGLAVTLVLSVLVNAGLQFLTGALLPLAVVRWFRELAGPGALRPEVGTSGEQGARGLHGRLALAGAVVAVVLALGVAWVASRGADREQPAEIIAHRGASGGAPENTMAAFELAIEETADWIELDVQEDADGEVIVAHDSDFMKQARVPLGVHEATAADLAEIDIGSWFDPTFSDQRPVHLRDVLLLTKGRIGVVIELKYYGHAVQLEERVASIVEETGTVDGVQIMSLDRAGLGRFAGVRPDWPRGLLNTASVGDLTRIDVDFLALNAAAATRRQIRRAHARGMRVYVWTINDPVQMSTMLSRGADGLITDEPAVARQVLEARETLGPVGRMIVWMAGEVGLLKPREDASAAADA